MSAQPAESSEYSEQISTARHNTKEIIETSKLPSDPTRLFKLNLSGFLFSSKQVTQSQTKGKGKEKATSSESELDN